jgi:spore coat polysaccharide biosynthesis protein SpsF
MAAERPRVVAVVQARMSSTRLPGKVLRPLAGLRVLDWVVRAARAAAEVDAIVVATSENPDDDAIAAWGAASGVEVVRGELDDVLSRFVRAAEATRADAVVRLTADCPLLDPALIDRVVRTWRDDPSADYVATTVRRRLPRGLDVELIRADVLRELAGTAEGFHRVHVTSAAYAADSPYRVVSVEVDGDFSTYRVTLDEPQDAAALEVLVPLLPSVPPAWQDVVAVLAAHPEVVALNAEVRQKELREA